MQNMNSPDNSERLERLRGDNLAVERGGMVLFAPVSFSLKRGDALLLEGANGVGKTSLMRAIAGLSQLFEGSITSEGLHEHRLEEHIHYLGHDNGIRPQLSVYETASFFKDYFSGDEDIDGVLKTLGLSGLEDIPCGYLSAGQKRKLAFSRLLLSWRDLWVLDEPLNALDTHARALVHQLIARHREAGGMVIAISHGGLVMAGTERIELKPLAIEAYQ